MNAIDEINLSRSSNESTLKDVHTFIQLTRSVTRSIQLNLNEIRIKLIVASSRRGKRMENVYE